ncbi:MAG: Hpt domain-containing protein, partial [Candidatus Heimdallarchaeota archaeon]|nr:Hpt domain-containing protein [Candidatus Heimdallarchaeota archaeon]
MDEDDSIEFQKVMLLELNERIDELNSGLLAYEKDPLNKTAYDEILRTLHGLKGLFSLSGYPKLSSITHSMEDLVNSIDTNRFKKIIAICYQYSDELARFSSSLSGGKTAELLRFDQLTQRLASFDEFIVNLGNKLRIKVIFNRDCKVISARCLVLTKKLKKKATIERIIPPLEEIQAGVSFKELIIEINTQEDDETIKQIVGETQDVTSANVSRLLDSVNIVGQTSIIDDSQEALNVRVNLHDLDQIIRFLGDLVVSGQFIREIGEEQAYSRDFKENLANFERTIADIQNLVVRMRMVPLETILSRFPRMVRDLSKKEGKEVDFIITGKHIGVDRSIIEHLVNPLTHLLRNAVSHGIEKPEVRIQKNKKSQGIIKLSVTQERSDIVIEVYDDGKGIDYDKIRRKGIELGLIDQSEELTKEELEVL